MSAEQLADVLTRHRVEERERAMRALLMHPLMTAAHPDFGLVRRHAEFLCGWLARETGWVLRVERDCARLYKLPADLADDTRGAAGFDRRRYVLFCLVCAVLDRADPQITLKTMGERLLALAADPGLEARGFVFTLDAMHERRELVHVCRYLLELGVLHRVAGEEESYVQRAGDALYDIARRALAGVLACTRGPSMIASTAEPYSLAERLAALTDEYAPDNPEGRRTAARHALARRLLDDPVVYFDELTETERDYLINQRGAMAARLRLATGLEPELRAEGVALVDPLGEVSDAALPAEGTVAHATLLVAQFLAERAHEETARQTPESEVSAFLRRAADEYGRYWRKSARDPGAEIELAHQALAQLAALKLVRRMRGVVAARPALLRFAFRAPQIKASAQTELTFQ
ncbi:MAG: TIGR02678 family protein [Betaproteobacteria bacterium RIFCSPLOWO2_12_FULL_62_13]|nr:MAG: TIGR02678 family protein [Betaproteobacteria bacterium RIFCSPLOWO2_12_FULL_62_13]